MARALGRCNRRPFPFPANVHSSCSRVTCHLHRTHAAIALHGLQLVVCNCCGVGRLISSCPHPNIIATSARLQKLYYSSALVNPATLFHHRTISSDCAFFSLQFLSRLLFNLPQSTSTPELPCFTYAKLCQPARHTLSEVGRKQLFCFLPTCLLHRHYSDRSLHFELSRRLDSLLSEQGSGLAFLGDSQPSTSRNSFRNHLANSFSCLWNHAS